MVSSVQRREIRMRVGAEAPTIQSTGSYSMVGVLLALYTGHKYPASAILVKHWRGSRQEADIGLHEWYTELSHSLYISSGGKSQDYETLQAHDVRPTILISGLSTN